MTDERNNTKFTPGPWKFIRVQPEIDTFAIRTINDDTLAAVGVSPVGWREGKDIANAALMAVAPEMHAELEKAACLLRTTAMFVEKQYGYCPIVAWMQHEADGIDALLARARGEAL